MIPFDPQAPHLQWFQSWRKRVALAQMEPDKAHLWSRLAMVSQMRYVTLAALEVVRQTKENT